MNAYWGRLVSVSAFILSLLFVQIWRISATPGGPDGGDIVVTAAIVPITAALIVLVYWARAQPARDRRRSLAGRDELTWLADVKVDQATLSLLVAGARPALDARSLALVLDCGELVLMATAHRPGVRFSPDEILSIEAARHENAIDWGQFVLTTSTRGEITMTLIGPLWGGYPASEEHVSRFVDELTSLMGDARPDHIS